MHLDVNASNRVSEVNRLVALGAQEIETQSPQHRTLLKCGLLCGTRKGTDSTYNDCTQSGGETVGTQERLDIQQVIAEYSYTFDGNVLLRETLVMLSNEE